jgi:hypothetical protein
MRASIDRQSSTVRGRFVSRQPLGSGIDKRAAAYANAYAYYTQRLSQYTIITHKFDNKWLHLHAKGHVISQN